MGRTTPTRRAWGPVMTNDTIDQDVGVTHAAVARLPRHTAVRADLDAARMSIIGPPTGAPTTVLPNLGASRTAMTADEPSRPLRGGKHPPLDCPINDVTAGGEAMDRLLSVNEAAEVLGTSVQFPRKLIAQRRIRFVRVGRLVRIPESAVREYIQTRTVEPVSRRRGPRVA